jgi:hypothetical protein
VEPEVQTRVSNYFGFAISTRQFFDDPVSLRMVNLFPNFLDTIEFFNYAAPQTDPKRNVDGEI